MAERTEVTQRIEFDCGYLTKNIGAYGYTLQCCRYKLEVTVDGDERFSTSGVVIDFATFKKYLTDVVPSHSFLYNTEDTHAQTLAASMDALGIPTIPLRFAISAEKLCHYIANQLQFTLDQCEPGVRIKEVRLRENTDSFATLSLR